MTELKTLKDFEKEFVVNEYGREVLRRYEEKLKAEAVKWVKKFLKQEKRDVKSHNYRKLAFMNFFNITEEDLK